MATEESRLDALLLDYEMTRDDERGFGTSLITLLGIAIAVLAALITVLTQVCVDPAKIASAVENKCTPLAPPVIALFPMAPLTIIIFIQLIGTQASVRSYYLRALEREIRKELGATHGRDFSQKTYRRLPLLSTSEIQAQVQTLSRGFGGSRVLTSIGLLAVILVFGGSTIYIGYFQDISWKIIMLIVYGGGAVLVLSETRRATIHAREYFESTIELVNLRMRENLRPFPARPRRERSLTSYLVLPRPDDLVKMAFMPAGMAVGVVVTASRPSLLPVWVLWVLLELFIYQARYQWNDLRGLAEDVAHPMSQARGRLPVGDGGPRGSVRASVTVMGLRLVLGYAIAALPGVDLGGWYLVSCAAVFGLAGLYEFLRSKQGSGRPWLMWAIYITVGLGYPLRGWSGFHLATKGSEPGIGIALAGFLAAYGSAFVLLTWALDAASYCTVRKNGARFRLELPARSAIKPHLAYLVPKLATVGGPEGRQGQDVAALSGRGALISPWNLASTLAGVLALLLGGHLCVAVSQVKDFPALTWSGMGLAASLVLISLSSIGWRLLWGCVTTSAGVMWVWCGFHNWLGSAMGIFPWTVLWITVLLFRKSSYADLKGFAQLMAALLESASDAIMRGLIGKRTADLLRRHSTSTQTDAAGG